jgi:hypothetical protein
VRFKTEKEFFKTQKKLTSIGDIVATGNFTMDDIRLLPNRRR